MKSRYLRGSRVFSSMVLGGVMSLSACNANLDAASPAGQASKAPPNILLMIGDDMGKDTLSCFNVGTSAAKTPNLDRLCANGVRFASMWTQPFCSPTRATMLTGEYGFSNGVFAPVIPTAESFIDEPERPADAPPEHRVLKVEELFEKVPLENIRASRGLKVGQRTIAQVLKESGRGYTTGAFGKWHMADFANGGLNHPNMVGFDHYSGFMEGTLYSFFAWKHVENGVEAPATGYFTQRMVDDTIEWINAQDDPWFAWVAFTAPHEPFHKPPNELLSAETAKLDPNGVAQGDDRPYFRAALEAMDSEVGRLLAAIPEDELANTYVIFIGDNGTPRETASAPYSSKTVKGSVYQGGIDMPFIISGPDIAPGVYPHLANSTDVFSSILELAGVDLASADLTGMASHSISFVEPMRTGASQSPRDWAYSEGTMIPATPTNKAIRNARYKLMVIKGEKRLFDLQSDPYEADNLLERNLSADAQAAYEDLNAQLALLVSP